MLSTSRHRCPLVDYMIPPARALASLSGIHICGVLLLSLSLTLSLSLIYGAFQYAARKEMIRWRAYLLNISDDLGYHSLLAD